MRSNRTVPVGSSRNKKHTRMKGCVLPACILLGICLETRHLNFVVDNKVPVPASTKESAQNPEHYPRAKESMDNLDIVIPAFPGGFGELKNTFARSYLFFWPQEQRRIQIVLDEIVLEKEMTTREEMNNRVQGTFGPEGKSFVSVFYNPFAPQDFFGGTSRPGWYMQQHLQLWADNFTDAKYIGFCDDDTLFTSAVNPEDLFDEEGRPHVIPKLRLHGTRGKPWTVDFISFAGVAFNTTSYLNGMTFFPFVIKSDHLRRMREAILKAHPGYLTYDDFISQYLLVKWRWYPPLNQFSYMVNYIWDNHRDEYNWHIEADDPEGVTPIQNIDAFTADYVVAQNPNNLWSTRLRPGTPAENGVTKKMLEPFPRVAVHANYELGGSPASFRESLVSSTLRRGYCFSQPICATAMDDGKSNPCTVMDRTSIVEECNRYKERDPNYKRGQFDFEYPLFGSLWGHYDPAGTERAHKNRRRHFSQRPWDEVEVEWIFSPESIKECKKLAGTIWGTIWGTLWGSKDYFPKEEC